MESISIVIAATSVVIGVTMALVQLRDFNRTRQGVLRMQLYQKFASEEFMRAWADVMWRQDWRDYQEQNEKFGASTNPEAWSKTLAVGNHMQTLAQLVQEKLMDADWIYEFHPVTVLMAWERYEPLVKGWRERFGLPTYWQAFEDLYEECKKRWELATGRKYERLYRPPSSLR